MALKKKRVPSDARASDRAPAPRARAPSDAYHPSTKRLQDANALLLELRSALEESASELRRLRRVSAEFLSTVGHELRTPLHAIIGYTDMLLEQERGSLNARQRRYLNTIRSNALHLMELVNNVLEFARANAGSIELKPTKFLLGEAIQAAIETLRPTADARQIELTAEISDGQSPVVADPVRFRQILINLLSNAVKFTDAGGKVLVRATTQDGGGCIVSVSDTGPGIDPADQEAIFEEFHRGANATGERTKRPGAGLGLAITRRLVELHGGTIRVDSTPGKGSTFTVVLPPPGARGEKK